MFRIYYVTSYGKAIDFAKVYTSESAAQIECDALNESGLPGTYRVECVANESQRGQS